jgi:hypothetical protein
MSIRKAYCDTSYDLMDHIPMLGRLALNEEQSALDGFFPLGSASFTAASALYTNFGKNDTVVIPEGESNAGVYHVNSVVSNQTVILSRTSVTSATGIAWRGTTQFRRAVERGSDEVDDRLSNLHPIYVTPFDKVLFQGALSAVGLFQESVPLALAGYQLTAQMNSDTYPIGLTFKGFGEWKDWRDAPFENTIMDRDVSFEKSYPDRFPVTTSKEITDSVSFTAAGTLSTNIKFREVTGMTVTTGVGTVTVRLTPPRQVKALTALEASIYLLRGNYTQGTSNQSDWIESLVKERERLYREFETGSRQLSELVVSTQQKSRTRSVKIARG